MRTLRPSSAATTPSTARTSFADYDFIVDCIDLVACKVDLIRTAKIRGIPIVSALGTGNKCDAQRLTLCDIKKTSGCPLARVVRKELRSIGIEHHDVVFSPEEAMKAAQFEAPPPGVAGACPARWFGYRQARDCSCVSTLFAL